jgi:uncharacterized repeat protein (TIGR01451 family)
MFMCKTACFVGQRAVSQRRDNRRFALSEILTPLAMMGMVVSSPAMASCTAANQYDFSFANQTATTLNYANSYTYTANSSALGAQNFTIAFTTNGLASSQVNSTQMPAISNLITDGVAASNLVIGAVFNARTPDIAAGTNVIVTTFTFPVPIRDFSVQINDVDFTSNQFRDWIQVTGVNGASSYDPAATTPWGMTNTVPGPHTDVSSSLVLGSATTPVSVTTSQAAGTNSSGNNSTTGTLSASFAQPVTSVQVRWGNYPLQSGETATGQQAIGIQQISYCPMPSLTVTKTASQVVTAATDPNRFAIPGADTEYTITVANTNSSPVDANSLIVADAIPAATTFYNGDIDGATVGTQNFVFLPGTSGLTLPSGSIGFSNNGGVSFGYTPGPGYDPALSAIRFLPQGTMAPNSSFAITFRVGIK